MRTGKVMILVAVLALVLTPVLASASVVETATAKGKPVQIDTECPLDGNTTPLIAGQNMEVGSVEVSYYGDELKVTFATNGEYSGDEGPIGWFLRETHLFVGVNPPDTNAPGQFPFVYDGFGYWETEFTYVIDLTEIEGYEFGDCLYIAAHAVVERFEYFESDLDGLAAALPDQATISVKFPGNDFGDPSYFDTLVSGGTSLDGTYDGFCIDTDKTISPGTSYTANVYSSYEDLADGLLEYPENLDLVNWIINRGFVGQVSGEACGFANYTYGDVQRAIWALIDDGQSTSGLDNYWTQCKADEIEAAARENGEGFEPGCDDYVAVILVPVGIDQTNNAQVTIAQVTFAQVGVPCVPVFTDETAWGEGGCQFDRGWGMYFRYCQQCADFTQVTPGQSVEGPDTVLFGLTIDTPVSVGVNGAIGLVEGGSVGTYGAPNNTCWPGSPSVINGCMDQYGGFGDIDAKEKEAHYYVFSFAEPVDGFSLRMLDFGDYNKPVGTFYSVVMTAYDENGVVATDTLAFATAKQQNPRTSDLGDLLCGTGDACDALPGEPGNYTLQVSASDIIRVDLDFRGGSAWDPNIGFDNLCVGRQPVEE